MKDEPVELSSGDQITEGQQHQVEAFNVLPR